MPIRDRERRRAHDRAKAALLKGNASGLVVREEASRDPLFDPHRDGPRYPRDLTGAILGDPPIGRSALDLAQQGQAPVGAQDGRR